jgi:hypothetical protein
VLILGGKAVPARRSKDPKLENNGYILDERRGSCRFELKLSVKYRAAWPDCALHVGYGQTRDISSNAVRFSCDTQLPVGSMVELLIDWPWVRDDAAVQLKLFGRVLRCEPRCAVVHIARYSLGPSHDI